jgi:hypothetical protein
MINTVPQLLVALGWPPTAGLQPGTLTWTHEMEEKEQGPIRVFTASVVLNPTAVFCRLRSASIEKPWALTNHMEAVWELQGGQPFLTKWSLEGAQQQAYESNAFSRAIEEFRNAVEEMNVEPRLITAGGRSSRAR